MIAVNLSNKIELENPNLNNKLISLEGLKEKEVQQCSLSLKKPKKPLLISHKIL